MRFSGKPRSFLRTRQEPLTLSKIITSLPGSELDTLRSAPSRGRFEPANCSTCVAADAVVPVPSESVGASVVCSVSGSPFLSLPLPVQTCGSAFCPLDVSMCMPIRKAVQRTSWGCAAFFSAALFRFPWDLLALRMSASLYACAAVVFARRPKVPLWGWESPGAGAALRALGVDI